MPIRWAGLCSGANEAASLMPWITDSSITTELVYFSPPCTIRWPIAVSCADSSGFCARIVLTIKFSASLWAAPAPKAASCLPPSIFHLIRASGRWKHSAKPERYSSPLAASMIANFSEELPQFRTSTNLLDMEVPIYDTWLKKRQWVSQNNGWWRWHLWLTSCLINFLAWWKEYLRFYAILRKFQTVA